MRGVRYTPTLPKLVLTLHLVRDKHPLKFLGYSGRYDRHAKEGPDKDFSAYKYMTEDDDETKGTLIFRKRKEGICVRVMMRKLPYNDSLTVPNLCLPL
jgi:hypothetical protein